MACYGVLRYHVLKCYYRGIELSIMVPPFGWLQSTPKKLQLQLHQPFHGVRNGKA